MFPPSRASTPSTENRAMNSGNRKTRLPAERLVLREWRDEDLVAFADLNADPRVMEHFPAALTRAESDEFAARIRGHFDEHGFGLWAVEVAGVAPFVGFVGLAVPRFEAHFTPCVEVGWRLAHAHWRKSYATEGARAAVSHGFSELGLTEIVAMTVPKNVASRRVMEKLGMAQDPRDDFDHPRLQEGHPHRRHVLYRLRRRDWPSGNVASE
jgi:ribosomal-protein-alanine N-acetyltransferase